LFQFAPAACTPDDRRYFGHRREDSIDRIQFCAVEPFRGFLTLSALAEWASFAASWDELGPDTYMADDGRYRRRRFAAFALSPERVVRKVHQPHHQSRDYNSLNGGIERWFGAVSEAITVHPVTLGLLNIGRKVFDALAPGPDRPEAWHVELHQFRIEARTGQIRQPTPEELHRDGVDWVLVVLVDRKNVESGVTSIFGLDRCHLGDFALTDPFDADPQSGRFSSLLMTPTPIWGSLSEAHSQPRFPPA
jgi:hypothetical protein